MNCEPKISIIIPVYNVEKYLHKCLDSCVNQTYKNIEIICVNDGSPDLCGEILAEYKDKYSQCKVITQKNAGVSAARNVGMKAASGDYLMFIDGDDWVDVAICSCMMAAALKYKANCVMCSYAKEFSDHAVINHIFESDLVWNRAEVARNFHRRLFGLVNEETRHPENGDLIVSPGMQLFQRELCMSATFVDLSEIGSAEDCLFQMEVYAGCAKFVYIDKPLYHYRKDNESSLTTRYNPYLFDRWQNLYHRMENLIMVNGYPDIYRAALSNRVLFGLIGLGLNEIRSGKSIFFQARRLKYMLMTERYQKAFAMLNISYMPFHWKIFFLLSKWKLTIAVIGMLRVIEFLRKHRK